MLLLANDLQKITLLDHAVNKRLRVMNFEKKFVAEITNELELQIDLNLKDEIKTPRYQEAFIHANSTTYFNFFLSIFDRGQLINFCVL